jgi:hypothetical protein
MKSAVISPEPLLIAAQAVPLDLTALGQFPILQFFGGLLILAGGGFAIAKGLQTKSQTPVPPLTDHPVQFHLQGPVQVALNTLRDMSHTLLRMEANQDSTAEKLVKQSATQDAHVRAVERNNDLLADLIRVLERRR